MQFVRAHSLNGLEGISSGNGGQNGIDGIYGDKVVFYPKSSSAGAGGFRDCCNNWIISGFVCEAYATPGSFAIGLGRNYVEAEDFCQSYYGGHLASIHNQRDYDKIADLSEHYTQPLMLGLRSDGAGNWHWEDGSQLDIEFLRAHSNDNLEGVAESVGVFYPPTGPASGDESLYNHGLHDWQNGEQPMAFVCSSSGEQRRMHLGSEGIPGYATAIEGCTNPAATNYDPSATLDDGSCAGGGH